MKTIVAAAILSVVLCIPAFAATTSPDNPVWCHPGYICLTREEVVKDAEYHYDLREQVLKYKASSAHFGWTIGPSIGVVGVIDRDYRVSWIPAVGLTATFGWRVH